MEKEKIKNETKNLLMSILDYCSTNDLVFYAEQKGGYYRMYVSDRTVYENYKKKAEDYIPFELNEKNIHEKNFSITRDPDGEHTFCSIQPMYGWAVRDNKRHTELYVHAFWNCNADIIKQFAYSWFASQYMDLTYAMQYSNKEYPKGFNNMNIVPYSSNKNWIHFLNTIPDELIVEFWEDSTKLEQFHQGLKKLDSNKSFGAHSYLRTLCKRVSDKGISEDAMVQTSYILMDLIPDDLKSIDGTYAEQFPFFKALLEQQQKDSFFIQSDEYIVEKVVLERNSIFGYFKNSNIFATDLIEMSVFVLTSLKENDDLKKAGLIDLDVNRVSDVIAYLTLTDNKIMNKHEMAKLFVKIMNNCFDDSQVLKANEDDFTVDPSEKVPDKNMVKEIANKTVAHWLLDKELNKDKSQKVRKNKI